MIDVETVLRLRPTLSGLPCGVSRVTSREAADPLHAVTASARAEAIQEERLATGYTILVVRIRFSVCHGECKSVELSMRQLTRVLRSLRR